MEGRVVLDLVANERQHGVLCTGGIRELKCKGFEEEVGIFLNCSAEGEATDEATICRRSWGGEFATGVSVLDLRGEWARRRSIGARAEEKILSREGRGELKSTTSPSRSSTI